MTKEVNIEQVHENGLSSKTIATSPPYTPLVKGKNFMANYKHNVRSHWCIGLQNPKVNWYAS